MIAVAEWRDVTCRYRGVTAVEDVSLALAAGCATALVGHNGAGKTTLIKLLLGLVRPSAGTVSIEGIDPAGRGGARTRRRIGFLPENVAFHAAMTGAELMHFYARLKGESPRHNAELLERVGIADAAHRRVGTYSKGMRQRLGIAQALIGAPRLLLFDEPTSGLDPASRAQVYETIERLRAEGATVLISTHALTEVEDRVDRVAILHRGRLLAAGALEELREEIDAELCIRVEVVACSTGRVLAALPPEVRVTESTEPSLELKLPSDSKMRTLQALVRCGECVLDVELATPGLQELYARLVGEAQDKS